MMLAEESLISPIQVYTSYNTLGIPATIQLDVSRGVTNQSIQVYTSYNTLMPTIDRGFEI